MLSLLTYNIICKAVTDYQKIILKEKVYPITLYTCKIKFPMTKKAYFIFLY